MKTILVLTDFTISSDHAAQYALKIAQTIKANILLCNIFLLPAEEPIVTRSTWQLENYHTLYRDSIDDLEESTTRLNKYLDQEVTADEFRPGIAYCSKAGSLAGAINDIMKSYNVVMAVVNINNDGGLSAFLVGNHARDVIEYANCPVLVVPYQAPIKTIKKIAFATDLTNYGINVLRSIADLARHFESEILITYVGDDKNVNEKEQNRINQFIKHLSAQINYLNVHYQPINNKSVTNGLHWLAANDDIDMIVLVHRKRNFIEKIFQKSVTQKMAGHLQAPMLVFPYGITGVGFMGNPALTHSF